MFRLGLRNKWCEEGIQFVSAVPPFQVKNNWEGNTPPILTFASVRFYFVRASITLSMAQLSLKAL